MASYRASLGLVGRSQTSFGSNILVHCTAYPLSPTANVMGRSSFSLPHTRPAHSASFPLASLVYGYIEMTAAAAAAACIQPPPHNRTNERTLVHCPSFDEIAFPRLPLPRLACQSAGQMRKGAPPPPLFVRSFLGSFSLSFFFPSFYADNDELASERAMRRCCCMPLPPPQPPRDD